MRSAVEVWQGDSPVVLGLPHTGTHVPEGIMAQLNSTGQALADTDWHVDRLYDGLLEGATTVRATFHRYVIDANRAPDDAPLYPGQTGTGLIPQTDFDGAPIWTTPPDAGDTRARLENYHAPYHAALRAELKRVHAMYGVVILLDCHSIRSQIPNLFDGVLPDLSVGTDGGVTCAQDVERAMINIAAGAQGYSAVLNGRFRGGWTTRHYGRPADGLHAVQLELAQSTYLAHETAPWTYDPEKADRLRPHLARMLHELAALAPTL